MGDYRHGAHSDFEIHLHLVWVTKYRKPVLPGTVGLRVRNLIREICGGMDVHILIGHASKDHVHLLVSIPPQVTIILHAAISETSSNCWKLRVISVFSRSAWAVERLSSVSSTAVETSAKVGW